MNKLQEKELLDCAEGAARVAGTYARENRNRRHEIMELAAHDIKLQLDHDTQVIAEEYILARYPAHGIIGEERHSESESLYQWIIDPIDGTINFFHGLPLWCCSIAVQREGLTIAGAVYLPDMEECFMASVNTTALCNGVPIAVSSQQHLNETLLLFGLGKPDGAYEEPIESLSRLNEKVRIIRIMGTAAVDMCMVACGKADAYMDNGIFIWDAAAAALIAERAGARVSVDQSDTKGRLRVVCSNPVLHEPLKEAYRMTLLTS